MESILGKMLSSAIPLLQVIKVVSASVASVLFLGFAALTFAGSAVALTISTPLFIIFSPVLIPATIATAVLTAGLTAAASLLTTAISLITWLIKHRMGVKPKNNPPPSGAPPIPGKAGGGGGAQSGGGGAKQAGAGGGAKQAGGGGGAKQAGKKSAAPQGLSFLSLGGIKDKILYFIYTPNSFKARGPVNPYRRGCSPISRCRR